MISLENKYLRLRLCQPTNGGLTLFEDVTTTRNFLSSTPSPLYKITLSKSGSQPIEITSQDANPCRFERVSESSCETAILTYDRHRSVDIGVTCKVILGR